MIKCTHAFAVPGKANMIDFVAPATGRSCAFGETLEQIRLRYPGAELVSIDEWSARRAAEQDSPVVWKEITEERWNEMLNVLPPIYGPGGFMVSEPVDHHAVSGKARYTAFIQRGGKWYESSRPMTVAEFRNGRTG